MGTRHARRAAAGALAVSLFSIALGFTPAGADPDPADPAALPSDPSGAVERLAELSRQSEQLNEALHNAQIDLDRKVAEQQTAEAVSAADRHAVDEVNARVGRYQPVIDSVAVANYRGAETSGVFAVLTSDSPQQLLDQMSMLDTISRETAQQVDQFRDAKRAAVAAEHASRTSADLARTAVEQARALSDDLQKKQSELQVSITEVIAAWSALSAGQQDSLAGSALPPGFDPALLLQGILPGSGASALRAALTRVGDPYVWGATGPDQFDCSGLVVWAYRQIGKELPRSSQAQMAGGTPVAREDLQPGDVVGFYNDASHVGIYAGNGLLLHASTFGVPVAVVPLANGGPYLGARRY